MTVSTVVHAQGPLRSTADFTARVVIPDLQGDALLDIQCSDGTRLTLAFDDAVALENQMRWLRQDIRVGDQARLALHHPLTRAGLAALVLDGESIAGAVPNDPALRSDTQTVLYPRDAEFYGREPKEGTPRLQWRARGRDSHWQLNLVTRFGPSPVLGEAQWDDPDSIANLVRSMNDQDTLLSLAGITNPEVVAAITSRQASAVLAQERSIPSMSATKARNILTKAGLAFEGGNRWDCGRIRFMTMEVETVNVPVAIVIMPPVAPRATFPANGDGQDEETKAESRRQWIQRAQEAFSDAGWYVVDLPAPYEWGIQHRGHLWVTRINPTVWGKIRAAAAAVAHDVRMSRGGKFL